MNTSVIPSFLRQPRPGGSPAAPGAVVQLSARPATYAHRLLTPAEFSTLLGCSPATVFRLIRQGHLGRNAVRIGRRWIIDCREDSHA